MKKSILFAMLPVIIAMSGCATLASMKGTYVTITPLAHMGFDEDNYEKLGFAYTPDSEYGRLFKKELTSALKASYYKIPDDKDEFNAVQQAGINFNGDVNIDDAQKVGKILKTDCMIIVRRFDFTADGRVTNVIIEIVDTYGGVLVRVVHRGGDKPVSIRDAAWEIVNGLEIENMKIKQQFERGDKRLIILP